MGLREKVAYVVAARSEEPPPTYDQLAVRLETTPGAIAGVMHRAGAVRSAFIRKAALNAHPLVQAIFAEARRQKLTVSELAKRSGYSTETIWRLRAAKGTSKFQMVVDMAGAVGLELYAGPPK